MIEDLWKPALRLQLPAILVRLWSRREDLALAEETAADLPGLLEVGEGLFAVVPVEGDAAVVETGYRFARRALAGSPERRTDRALLFPGDVTLENGRAVALPNVLLDDIERAPPELEPGEVHLTGHASSELESRFALTGSPNYRGPSGRELPLWRLGGALAERPWRNPRMLNASQAAVSRPEPEDLLLRNLVEPAQVILGPLGCGKTRVVFEVLGDRRALWATPWSPRSGGPGLAKQWLRQLAGTAVEDDVNDEPAVDPAHLDIDREVLVSWWRDTPEPTGDLATALIEILGFVRIEEPLYLVCDDVHALGSEDRELLGRLLELPMLGQRFRLVLIGRSGLPLGPGLGDLPTTLVPPMSGSEMSEVCENLLAGLSVPETLREQFLASSQGFPFALEEGLLQLVRRKVIRRVYGNFFYSGGPDAALDPSARLIRQLEAEVRRLGSATALRTLAIVGSSLSADDLGLVAGRIDDSLEGSWVQRYVDAGVVRSTHDQGDMQVELACELHLKALRQTVSPGSVDILRRLVGEQLAATTQGPDEEWQAYRLLSGTPEAAPLLLRVARSPRGAATSEELFHALTDELESHRERHGEESSELEILWALLPLARRMGRLRDLREAIERALQLATHEPERLIALIALKAEQDQNEGKLKLAEAAIVRGLELARASDDRRKALLVVQLGKILQRQDRYPEARKLFEEILPVLEREGNDSLASTCRFHLGNVALHEKRLEAALSYHQQALESRRRLGLVQQLGASLSALGAIYLALGNYPEALRYYRDAEAVLEQHGREGEVGYALVGVGRTLSRLGDYTAASQPFRKALACRRDRDDKTGEAIARLLVAENHLNLGQSELALEEARQAYFHLSMVDAPKQLGDAEQILGRIRLKQRQYEDARQHFEGAIAAHQHHGDVLAAAFDRAFLLETSMAVSDHRRIEELCSALVAVLETLRYPELGEMLDVRLYQGLEWLRQRGRDTDPLKALRRGYRELFRKTELLEAELRNRFLYQIPDNRAILNAATLHGLQVEEPTT